MFGGLFGGGNVASERSHSGAMRAVTGHKGGEYASVQPKNPRRTARGGARSERSERRATGEAGGHKRAKRAREVATNQRNGVGDRSAFGGGSEGMGSPRASGASE